MSILNASNKTIILRVLTMILSILCCYQVYSQDNFIQKLDSINEIRINKDDFIHSMDSLKEIFLDSFHRCDYKYKYYKVLGRFYFNVMDDNDKSIIIQRDSVLPNQLDCETVNNHDISTTYFNIGLAHQFNDHYKDAERYYQKALYFENNANGPDQNTYNKFSYISEFFRLRGDPQKAQFYIKKAKSLYNKDIFDRNYIILLRHEAKSLIGQNLYSQALTKLIEIENILLAEDTSYPDISFHNYVDMADTYRLLNKNDKARITIDIAEKLLNDRDVGYHRKLLILKERESFIYNHLGKHESALKELDFIHKLFSSGLYKPTIQNISGTYENRGDVYFEAEKFELALKNYQRSIDIFMNHSSKNYFMNPIISNSEILDIVHVTRQFASKGRCFYALAEKQGGILLFNKTIETFQKFDTLTKSILLERRDDFSHQKHMDESRRFYNLAIKSCLEAHNLSQNVKYINKAYEFISSLKSNLLTRAIKIEKDKNQNLSAELHEKDSDFKEQVRSAKESYEKAILSENKELQDEKFNTYFKVKNDYEFWQIDNGLLEKLDSNFIINTPTSSQVQAKLLDHQAILEFHYADSTIYSFLITKDEFRHSKTKLSPDEISNCVLGMNKGQDLQSCESLYPLIDILKDLEEKKSELIIIPDGPLHLVPFEAIKNLNGEQLVEQFDISYQYSSSFFQEKLSNNKSTKMAAFGSNYESDEFEYLRSDLEYLGSENNVSPLSHTISEVENVGKFISTNTFLNDDATKENLLNPANDYGAYHFALHGILNNRFPDQSALVFNSEDKDFLLTAAEIYNLDLPSQLTVLTACNSAAGPILLGEGTKSLTRSFIQAGSNSVLTSLWSASDASTQKIVSKFYKYLKDGKSKSKALRQAKLDYLETASPSFQHPRYWAHLVLVGDTSPLDFGRSAPFLILLSSLLVCGILILLLVWKRSRKSKIL